jgi:hypothetical protein
MILACVPTGAVLICDTSWFAFTALTVEAGGVRGVLNVTDVGDVLVAEGVVSASCDLNTLVACALVASFTVGVVNASWCA